MSIPAVPGGRPGRPFVPGGAARLSLQAYVARESAAIAAANGPTMAAILEDLDRLRTDDGPTTQDIVDALYETRGDREDDLDQPWA